MAKRTTTSTPTKVKVDRGPMLVWNQERDIALVTAVSNGAHRAAEIADAVRDDEAFEGISEMVTPLKCQFRLAKLRKAGVNVPNLGRTRYAADIDTLNALLPDIE